MSKFYFVKIPYNCANLKVINDRGEELSLSGDDNCGVLPNYGRISLAMFRRPDSAEQIGEEIFWAQPEDLLQKLAAHLGYEVVKKSE